MKNAMDGRRIAFINILVRSVDGVLDTSIQSMLIFAFENEFIKFSVEQEFKNNLSKKEKTVVCMIAACGLFLAALKIMCAYPLNCVHLDDVNVLSMTKHEVVREMDRKEVFKKRKPQTGKLRHV